MEGVGPGTTLDGRYTTQRRIEQRGGAERWAADDTTLGRSVVVLCLPEHDHRASALLDAARRAAGLDAPTLQRVLDVGRENGVAWVVESDDSEARTLTQLVHEGGLPADEVRRIVGEVATALESARHRGLHHLDLRPDDVLRTIDGEIRLRGVATSAALIELDDLESEVASRRDAIGVVCLTYAGLTGLWPGAGETSLGPAPLVMGGVAAPSEIAAGVPRDLDTLCRLTLGEDQGPTSPGDFARQVAPWPSRQVAGRSTLTTTAAQDPRVNRPSEPPALTPAALSPATPAPGAPEPEPGEDETRALEPQRRDDEDDEDDDHDPEADVPTRVMHRPAVGTGATEVIPTADPQPTETLPVVLPDTGEAPDADADVGSSPDVPRQNGARAAESAAAAAAATGAALAGASSVVAGAVNRAGSRVGSLSRQVGERAAEKAAERRGFRERITAPNAPAFTTDGERVRPGTGRDTTLEPPAPLVPAQPLNRRESRLALGIVAAFLILALFIGIKGVLQIGSNTDLDFGGVPGRSASTSPSAGASPGSGTPTPSASATTGEALQILAADGFDPEGDGRENGTRAPRVFDGNPSTAWQSEGYGSARLGGLKSGVGVSVDLGPNVTARSISLTLGNEADVEVYVSSERRLRGATKVGEKAGADGTVTFPVAAGTTGQYVIVWFTSLTQDDNGRYRAILGEVEVKN
ncbi:hypothetical protein ACOCJ4_09875 [Knoellia sp. CPCC 206435]|uniref:hypothetical protein n=1 Tax=Knoellia terrae TaxID=3404797 RepID=UPI003B42D508